MELVELQALCQQYRVKRAFHRRPNNEALLPAITALNLTIAAITPAEFRIFLAQVNRNRRSIAYLETQFARWQQLIGAETTCLHNGQLDQLPVLIGEDLSLFRQICRTVRAHYSVQCTIEVIGFGELSASLILSDAPQLTPLLIPQPLSAVWVYKSLPVFSSLPAFERYQRAFEQYLEHVHSLGLLTPAQKLIPIHDHPLGVKVYLRQRRLDTAGIGHVLLKTLDEPDAMALLKKVICQIRPIFAANQANAEICLGFDGQISNWYFPDLKPETKPIYFDTGAPLLRLNCQEQLDPEIFLQTTPPFLRAIIRKFFLKSVLDRYYDFRSVIVDLLANLYKEGCGDLVAPAVKMVNEMLAQALQPFDMRPFTLKEIRAYYREDVLMLDFFQMARRTDRFITETILRKPYLFRLPGKINR